MYAYLQCVAKLLEAKADTDMKMNKVSDGGGGMLMAVGGWRGRGREGGNALWCEDGCG